LLEIEAQMKKVAAESQKLKNLSQGFSGLFRDECARNHSKRLFNGFVTIGLLALHRF
jgi:hypothetical protein